MEYLKVTKNQCCSYRGGESEYYAMPNDGWMGLLMNLYTQYGGDNRGAYYLSSKEEADELYPNNKYEGIFPAYVVYDHSEIAFFDAKDGESIIKDIMSADWGDWSAQFVDESDLTEDQQKDAELRTWNKR